jgi:hypothetical protein
MTHSFRDWQHVEVEQSPYWTVHSLRDAGTSLGTSVARTAALEAGVCERGLVGFPAGVIQDDGQSQSSVSVQVLLTLGRH